MSCHVLTLLFKQRAEMKVWICCMCVPVSYPGAWKGRSEGKLKSPLLCKAFSEYCQTHLGRRRKSPVGPCLHWKLSSWVVTGLGFFSFFLTLPGCHHGVSITSHKALEIRLRTGQVELALGLHLLSNQLFKVSWGNTSFCLRANTSCQLGSKAVSTFFPSKSDSSFINALIWAKM